MLKKPWFWPAFIIGLLSMGVIFNVVLVVVANNDPSFAVEPDYYKKALAWDQTMAQEQQNMALGWEAKVTTSPAAAEGQMEVVARIAARDGAAVIPDEVTVEAFHNARANAVLTATLARRDDGSYGAEMPMRRPGMWEFRLAVRLGDEHFTQVIKQDVFVPRPGARAQADRGRRGI